MLSKVSSYIKNVGKSVYYAAVDVIKEDNENIAEFVETNQDLFKSAYKTIRDYKTTYNRLESSFAYSKIYQAADIGINAIFEDLRNGTFYNKKREDEIATKLGGFGGGDDLNIDIDVASGSSSGSKLDISDGDKLISDTVEKSSRDSAELISDTIVRSSKATLASQRADTRLMYTQNLQIISGVKGALEGINGVGRTVNTTNSMLQTMADNQKKFYENTTKNVNEMRAMMQEMLEMQRSVYKNNQDNENKKKKLGYSDVVGFSGMPNLENYGKIVKKNISNKLEEAGFGMLSRGMGEGSNMFAQFTASPLKFIPTAIIKAMIPEVTREAMKSLNNTLSGVFSTSLAKILNWKKDDNSSPIKKLIGEIFGLKVNNKTSVDTNKFQKGPVPFDGIVRKSIVEVIPSYLRRIEAILAGKRERAYDYESGKWVDFEGQVKIFSDNQKSRRLGAFSDFRAERNRLMKNVKMSNYDDQKKMMDEQERILMYIYNNYGNIKPFTKSGKDHLSNLARAAGVSDTSMSIFKAVLENMEKSDPRRYRAIMSGMANNVITNMEAQARNLEALSKSDSLVISGVSESHNNMNAHLDKKYDTAVGNGITSALMSAKDKYNNTIFGYAFSVDKTIKEIKNILLNMKYGGGGGNSGSARNRRRNYNGRNDYTPLPENLNIEPSNTRDTKTAEELKREETEKERAKYDQELEKAKESIPGFKAANFYEGAAVASTTMAETVALENHKKDLENRGRTGVFADLFGEVSREKEYKATTFTGMLLEANTIGEKFDVIKRSIGKLAAAPMKMLTEVIEKADQSVYKFMFGDKDEELDEDGNPIHGLFHKMVTEMKKTFEKLNNWLNEKIIEPLQKKLGIHNMTEALDKVTGGRFSDAKEVLATTILGSKGADGRRTGGWADPFRNAFRYNWEAAINSYKDPKVAEAEEKAKAEAAERAAALETHYYGGTASGTIIANGDEWFDFGGTGNWEKINKSGPQLMNVPAGTRIANLKNASGIQADRKKELAFKKSVMQKIIDSQLKNFAEGTDSMANKAPFTFGKNKVKLKGYTKVYEFKSIEEKNKFITKFQKYIDDIRRKRLDTKDPRYSILANEFKEIKRKVMEDIPLNPREYTVVKEFVKSGKVDIDFGADEEPAQEQNPKSAEELAAIANDLGTNPNLNKALKNLAAKYQYDANNKESASSKRVLSIADATAKGVIGGGAGLLLGNPILGIVSGIAASVAKNSDTVNRFLFGSISKDGERIDDGLISKKTQEIFQKAAPEATKFGLIGTAAGFLTGLGPIPGLLIGGATAFAKNNEDIMSTLFGPKEERDKKVEDIKKKMPGIGLGAAAGALALTGPLGLVGGLMVGGASGFVAQTNTFKDVLFGEEDEDGNRKGGIAGAIKEAVVDPLKDFAEEFKNSAKEFIKNDILEPVKNAIMPITTAIGNITKSVLGLIPNTVNWIFERALGIPLGDFVKDKILTPMGKLIKGVLFAPAKILKGIISAPFKLIGGIGNRVRESQIRRGTANYMTAAERMEYRREHASKFKPSILHPFRKDKMAETDELLAGMSIGDAESTINEVDETLNNKTDIRTAMMDSRKDLADFTRTKFTNKFFTNKESAILKAIKKGNFKKAEKIIATAKTKDGSVMTQNERQSFLEEFNKRANVAREMTIRNNIVNKRNFNDGSNILNLTDDDMKALGNIGINVTTKKGLQRYKALLKSEQKAKAKFKGKNANDPNLNEEETHYFKLVDKYTEINNATLTILTNMVRITNGLAEGASDFLLDPENYREKSKGIDSVINDVNNHVSKNSAEQGIINGVSSGLGNLGAKDAKSKAKAEKYEEKYQGKENKRSAKRMTKLGIKQTPENDNIRNIFTAKGRRTKKIFKAAKKSNNDINIDNLDQASKKNKKIITRVKKLAKYIEVQKKEDIEYISRLTNFSFKNLLSAIEIGVPIFEKDCLSEDARKALVEEPTAAEATFILPKLYKLVKNLIIKKKRIPTADEIRDWRKHPDLMNAVLNNSEGIDQYAKPKNLRFGTKRIIKATIRKPGEEDSDYSSIADDLINEARRDRNFDHNNFENFALGTVQIKIKSNKAYKFSSVEEKNRVISGLTNFKAKLIKKADASYNDTIKAITTLIDKLMNDSALDKTDKKILEQFMQTNKVEKIGGAISVHKVKLKVANNTEENTEVIPTDSIEENTDGKKSIFSRIKNSKIGLKIASPIKAVKNVLHGTKEDYENAKANNESFNIFKSIGDNVKELLQVTKDRDDDDGSKEPLWKRILKKLFGVAILAGGSSIIAGVGKNIVWPWMTNTVGPWFKGILFGKDDDDTDGIIGKMKHWWNDNLIPALFGTKGEDGIWSNGLFSGLANFWDSKVSPFLFGTTGKDGTKTGGLVPKIIDMGKSLGTKIVDGFTLIKDFFTNTDHNSETFGNLAFSNDNLGISGLFKFLVDNGTTGFEMIFSDLLPRGVELLIKYLPKILIGAVKGLGAVLSASIGSIFGKKVPDASDIEGYMDTSNLSSEGYKAKFTNGEYVLSTVNMSDPWSATSSRLGSIKTGGSSKITFEELQQTESYKQNIGKEAVSTIGLNGGADYTILDGIESAAARSFLTGKTPIAAKAISKVTGVTSKVLGKIPVIGNAAGMIDAAAKGTEFILGKSANTGNALRNLGNKGAANATEELLEQGAMHVDDVAEIGSKGSSIGGKITKAVTGAKEAITNTAVGGKIAKGASIVKETVQKGAGHVNEFAKAISDILKNAGDFIASLFNNPAVEKVAANAVENTGRSSKGIGSLLSKLSKSVGGAIKGALSKAANTAGFKVVSRVASSIASKLPLINIAIAIIDFVSGCDNAMNILGIIRTPSFPERLLAGLLNVICNWVTFGLIPANAVLDILFDTVLPTLFGDNFSTGLMKDREDALNTIAIMNAEKGTNYATVEDYNRDFNPTLFQQVGDFYTKNIAGINDDDSLGMKAVKVIVSPITGIVKFFTEGIPYLVEHGKEIVDEVLAVGGSTASNIVDKFKTAWDTGNIFETLFVAGGNSTAKTAFGRSMTDVLTFIGTSITMPVLSLVSLIGAIKNAVVATVDGLIQVGPSVIDTLTGTFKKAWDSGNIIEAYGYTDGTQHEGFAGVLGATLTIVGKIVLTPALLVTSAIGGIKNLVVAVIDGIMQVAPSVLDTLGLTFSTAWESGDPIAAFSAASENEPEGAAGIISSTISTIGKIVLSPAILITSAIGGIKNIVMTTIDGIIAAGPAIADTLGLTFSTAWETGDPVAAFSATSENEPEGLGGIISSTVSIVGKVLLAPVILVTSAIGAIKNIIGGVFDDFGKIGDDIEFEAKLYDKAANGKISAWGAEYWADLPDNDGPLSLLRSIRSKITRFFGAIGASIASIIPKPIKDALQAGIDAVTGFFGGIGDFIGNVVDFFTGGSGKTAAEMGTGKFGLGTFGRGTDHIDQRSSNMRYNAPGDTTYQTVADSGCGPAAAATVLSHFGKGKLEEAARYSLKNGYKEPDGGTYPGFFGDYLGQNGINTQYETSASGVMNSLNNGNPVILMGHDNDNNGYTPYTDNGTHYVVATGIDRNGNMIIEDPDSRRGATRYNAKNVLSKSSIAISTNGRGGRTGRSYGKAKRSYGKATNMQHRIIGTRGKPRFGRGGVYLSQAEYNKLNEGAKRDICTFRESTAKQMADFFRSKKISFKASLFKNKPDLYAKYIMDASKESGIDPAVIMAIAAQESGWGDANNTFVKERNNFWGWGSWDSDLNKTKYFSSNHAEAFKEYAKAIRKEYYDIGQYSLYLFCADPKHSDHNYNGDITWIQSVSGIADDYHNFIHDYGGDLAEYHEPTFSSEKKSTVFDLIKDIGVGILKGLVGEDLYNALFGSTGDNNDIVGANGGYYAGEFGSNLTSTPASDWFETTIPSHVSSEYGAIRNLKEYGGSEYDKHKGIDFGTYGVSGLPIYSPIDGVVDTVKYDEHGFGNYLTVTDAHGYQHVFAHQNRDGIVVNRGDQVYRGDLIGHIGDTDRGDTGLSTGEHLHYQINKTVGDFKGSHIDPNAYPYWKDYYSNYASTSDDYEEYENSILPGRKDEIMNLIKMKEKASANGEYQAANAIQSEIDAKIASYKQAYGEYIKLKYPLVQSSELSKIPDDNNLKPENLIMSLFNGNSGYLKTSNNGNSTVIDNYDYNTKIIESYINEKFGSSFSEGEGRKELAKLKNVINKTASSIIEEEISSTDGYSPNREKLQRMLGQYVAIYNGITKGKDPNKKYASVYNSEGYVPSIQLSPNKVFKNNDDTDDYKDLMYPYLNNFEPYVNKFGKGKGGKINPVVENRRSLNNRITKAQSNVNALKSKMEGPNGDRYISKITKEQNNLNKLKEQYKKRYKTAPSTSFGLGRAHNKTIVSNSGINAPKFNIGGIGGGFSSDIVNTTNNNNTNINYTKMILAIIEVLGNISDNTALLTKVIDLLKTNSNRLGIDVSGLGKGGSKNNIKPLANRSSSSFTGSELSGMAPDQDTAEFMNAVIKLARE